MNKMLYTKDWGFYIENEEYQKILNEAIKNIDNHIKKEFRKEIETVITDRDIYRINWKEKEEEYNILMSEHSRATYYIKQLKEWLDDIIETTASLQRQCGTKASISTFGNQLVAFKSTLNKIKELFGEDANEI